MPDPDFTLATLGGLELRRGRDGKVPVRSRKARALLAVLAAQPGLAMSRGGIAGLLWSDRAETQARASLRQALSELRRTLGEGATEVLRATGEEVTLDGDRIEIDVVRFEALALEGTRAALEQAVSMWRGPFLDGFDLREDAFDEWLMQERRQREARLLAVLDELASRCEGATDVDAALDYVDRIVELAPLREEAHRRGMALCQRLGRTTEALERFERLRAHLAEELGVEPQAESLAVYEAVRKAHATGASEGAGPRGPDPAAPLARRPDTDGRPSIAVLPFVNLSGDSDQEYFADGMTEDIITELSRFRGLLVIARNSTFVYKGRAVDTREVARELGVKYVLEGSVRSSRDRIRVSAQLIDAATRSHLWAERYDRELSDLFGLQEEIVRTLVAAAEPELDEAERREATAASPEELDAWGAYQRGMWHIYRFTKEDTAKGLALFEKAIEAAPAHTPGWTGKAFAHFSNVFLGFVDDRDSERARCLDAARRAVELDTRNASAHWALGRAYSLARDYDRALAELENAVELNANHAQAWYQLGWVLVRVGRPQEALEHLITAERMSPKDPLRFAFLIARAQAHFSMAEYSKALALAERAAQLPQAHAQIEAIRVACLVLDGRVEEGKKAMEKFREENPEFTGAFFAEVHGFAREADLVPYVEALAKAGLPR